MRRAVLSVEDYVNGIRASDRVTLGRAITLIESARPEHAELARQVVARLLEDTRPSSAIRIAITGAPGVGKSTFIEALGMFLVGLGQRVAVLAIDPSSAVSGGSILGDKTRMERLSQTEMAFIRPSPSGQTLGGVARKTRETILLVEAAGYDVVLIETVGVGQSEIAARHLSDLFVLLLLPDAGDELQGIKRGIVEMADMLVVNKAEGERLALARQAQAHYLNASHLFPPHAAGWVTPVLTCSATDQTGFDKFWEQVEKYRSDMTTNGFLQKNRSQQAAYWLKETLESSLIDAFYRHPAIQDAYPDLLDRVLAGKTSPFAAAEILLGKVF
jgi:LAO/AO transport system kinase